MTSKKTATRPRILRAAPIRPMPAVAAAIARGEMAFVDTGLGVAIGVPVGCPASLAVASDLVAVASAGAASPAPVILPCDVEPTP